MRVGFLFPSCKYLLLPLHSPWAFRISFQENVFECTVHHIQLIKKTIYQQNWYQPLLKEKLFSRHCQRGSLTNLTTENYDWQNQDVITTFPNIAMWWMMLTCEKASQTSNYPALPVTRYPHLKFINVHGTFPESDGADKCFKKFSPGTTRLFAPGKSQQRSIQ